MLPGDETHAPPLMRTAAQPFPLHIAVALAKPPVSTTGLLVNVVAMGTPFRFVNPKGCGCRGGMQGGVPQVYVKMTVPAPLAAGPAAAVVEPGAPMPVPGI
jgi:hypothetical protein